jgi:hypothetical protein
MTRRHSEIQILHEGILLSASSANLDPWKVSRLAELRQRARFARDGAELPAAFVATTLTR